MAAATAAARQIVVRRMRSRMRFPFWGWGARGGCPARPWHAHMPLNCDTDLATHGDLT